MLNLPAEPELFYAIHRSLSRLTSDHRRTLDRDQKTREDLALACAELVRAGMTAEHAGALVEALRSIGVSSLVPLSDEGVSDAEVGGRVTAFVRDVRGAYSKACFEARYGNRGRPAEPARILATVTDPLVRSGPWEMRVVASMVMNDWGCHLGCELVEPRSMIEAHFTLSPDMGIDFRTAALRRKLRPLTPTSESAARSDTASQAPDAKPLAETPEEVGHQPPRR